MQTVSEILKFCEEGLHGPEVSPEEAAKLHVEKGGALVASGRFEEAKQDFLQAIEHSPNFAEAYNNLSNLYSMEGNFDQAVEFGAKAHELDPDTHELNWLLAREGKRMTDKLKETPHPQLFYKRGILFDRQGAHEKAVEDFQKAIELDPEFDDAYKELGDVYLKLGKVEDAVKAYDDVSDRVHDYDFKEEDFLFKIKRWEHLIKKVELHPRAADCTQLAIFYTSQKTVPSYKMARECFKKALSLDPFHAVALEGLIETEEVLQEKGLIEAQEALGPPVLVPSVIGLTKFLAVSELRTVGFEPDIKYQRTEDSLQHGLVMAVDPPVGTVNDSGNKVTLTIGHPGLALEAIEGIGDTFQETLIQNGIPDLASLNANPTIGEGIPGLSGERTTHWAQMASWLLAYPGEIDGNLAEIAVAGLGISSPEKAYERFLGMSLEEIRTAIKEVDGKVKLPANYLEEHLESFANLIYEIQ